MEQAIPAAKEAIPAAKTGKEAEEEVISAAKKEAEAHRLSRGGNTETQSVPGWQHRDISQGWNGNTGGGNCY